MIDQETVSKLRRLMEAREARDTSKQQAERYEKDYRNTEAEVWEFLEDSPLQPPYKVDLGEPYGTVRFHNRETYYGRVIDEEAALEGFENRAVIDELTKPKIVMQRVNEIVRDCLEQGHSMPPGLDYYAKRFVAITKEKG